MLSRDPARSRPPTDRPLDIVGLELLLCVTQALLAGMLLTLALTWVATPVRPACRCPASWPSWGSRSAAAWVWWLSGGSGWPLAAVDLAVALLTGALWLLSLQDAAAPRIDPLVGLIALSRAPSTASCAGVFLPGPRRGHWKGGVSQPRRGLPETRATPARFSPPVQKVVDERLASVGRAPDVAARRAERATPKPMTTRHRATCCRRLPIVRPRRHPRRPRLTAGDYGFTAGDHRRADTP